MTTRPRSPAAAGTRGQPVEAPLGRVRLIGSATVYDRDPTGLAVIQSVWTSEAPYQDRITALTTTLGPDLSAATVPDDGVRDVLRGGQRDPDWFVVSPPDAVAKGRPEVVTVL